MSVAEMRKFFYKVREDVAKTLKGGLVFDSDAFESILKKEIGAEMKMSDVKYPRYQFLKYVLYMTRCIRFR